MNRTFTKTRAMRVLILAALISFFSAPNLFSDEPDKTLHNKCIYPTVMITGPGSTGSGTIIRSEKVGDKYHNVVLSCAHIFSGSRWQIHVPKYKEWSVIDGYDVYSIRPIRTSREKDLSVSLFASDKKMPVAELDFDSKLYIGSEVFRTGFGIGDEMRLDFGKITSLRGRIKNGPIKNTYRMSAYTVPGDSGGPVFHNYKIVAITQAIRSVRRGYQEYPCFGISYSVPLSRFKKWDQELNNVLSFTYKTDLPMPIMWDKFLEFESWKPSRKMVPNSTWEN